MLMLLLVVTGALCAWLGLGALGGDNGQNTAGQASSGTQDADPSQGAGGAGAGADGASGGDDGLGGAADAGAGLGAEGGAGGQASEDEILGQALPPELAARFGASTFRELDGLISQARGQGDLVRGYEALLEQMQNTAGQVGSGTPPVVQGAAPAAFFGFGSREALVAAMNADYPGTFKRQIQHLLQHDPDFKKQLAPIFQEQLAPLQRHAIASAARADLETITARYPDAKNPAITGAGTAVARFAQANESWLTQLKESNPGLNVHEIAFKVGDYDRLAARLKALEGKAAEHRASAGTARAGVGGRTVAAAPKTHRDAVLRAAENMRARGIRVSQEEVEKMLRTVGNK
jgi:hypothetical protein